MITLLIAVVVLFVAIAAIIGSGLRAVTLPLAPVVGQADWAVDHLLERPVAFLEVTGYDGGVCASGEAHTPYSWYNVCPRMSSRITEEGIEIFSPLSWRIEMAVYDGDRFYAVCNDPSAMCNGLEAISLKAEVNLDRAFAATFTEKVGLGWCAILVVKTSFVRAAYVMSLAFRRGIIITPAVKAAKAATSAFSPRGDSRKSNRGGEERAEALRNARAFVRSQKEVELC